MPTAPLRLVRRCFELAPKRDVALVPRATRGIYVLYQRRRPRRGTSDNTVRFEVVYIGLASEGLGGVRGRLRRHHRSKGEAWTHFSVFEVWDNIRNDEIRELEGLFRHIYRFDTHANKLNVSRSYQALTGVRKDTTREGWMDGAESAVPKRRQPSRRRTSGGHRRAT